MNIQKICSVENTVEGGRYPCDSVQFELEERIQCSQASYVQEKNRLHPCCSHTARSGYQLVRDNDVRRALLIFKDVLLRTSRGLSIFKVGLFCWENGYPPSKSGRFSVKLYPIVRHIFHPICINLLELNTNMFIFSVVQGFCRNKHISIHYLWWLNNNEFNQFDVGHDQFYPCFQQYFCFILS